MALDTQALVHEASELTPLPRAVTQLIAILARDDWQPREVLEVVRLDPVLTGKVLGAANSVSSGAQVKIHDVEDAVRRIGPRAVVGFALAAGAKNLLSRALPQFELAEGELWRHSVAALLAAEAAGPYFRLPVSNAAPTAALVHDVGKVLMARFLDPETLDYLRLAQLEGGESMRGAEMQILSISHGELGALVAAHWGLPEEIVRAVQYHHDLENVPSAHRHDAAMVLFADRVAKLVAPSRIQRDDTGGKDLPLALAVLGLEITSVEALAEVTRARFTRLGDAY